MDILWAAASICAIVFVLFFALAHYWHKIIKQQSWTIRELAHRVKDLEEVGDPEFRRRVANSSPMPLEQVFHFSFHLGDRFWRDQLRIRDRDWEFIRASGSFVGSVKFEKWRSHIVATVSEVLPENSTARWETRALDYYPGEDTNGDGLRLWELQLDHSGGSADRLDSLALVFRQNKVELYGCYPAGNGNGSQNGTAAKTHKEIVFFSVPLDSTRLVNYRGHDPAEPSYSHIDESFLPAHEGSWQAFYSNNDEVLGLEWQLRLRDLNKKAEWERWKVLEAAAVPMFARNASE